MTSHKYWGGIHPWFHRTMMFKTVLLSQLFITDHIWKKDFCSERIIHVLELVLQGVMRGEIQSFFISGYNLLSVADHENKLRQCVVEEIRDAESDERLEMARTMEEAREIKQQIRFTELNTTELDEDAYKILIQIWSVFGSFLQAVTGHSSRRTKTCWPRSSTSEPGRRERNSSLSTRAFPNMKSSRFLFRQVAFEWLEDLADCYIEGDNSTLPNLHKAVSLEFSASGFFHDVADVTMKEGSDRGLDSLKQRLKEYLFMVPDNYLKCL
ncbi:hypothetical protein OS493_032495 [Desmophyllum pertusum]|uniref:Uncharacterized protein n=1 Tax=Desmophyllum pertusum TaxID=174260 RepID=A0A9X0D0N3_9CNID|nr:hypothetical protein OS493_032495 [Desmophyllum pertusum]